MLQLFLDVPETVIADLAKAVAPDVLAGLVGVPVAGTVEFTANRIVNGEVVTQPESMTVAQAWLKIASKGTVLDYLVGVAGTNLRADTLIPAVAW